MKTNIKTAAIAAVLTALAGFASAAPVANGSFEDIGDGSFNRSGWNLFAGIPDWSAGHLVEVQSNKTLGSIDAQDGSNYAELVTNRNDSLSQDLFLGLGNYRLSFFYSPRVRTAGTTSNDMSYSVKYGDSTLVSEDVDGAPGPDTPWGEWTEITSIFSVTEAGRYTLSFSATGSSSARGCGNCGALIDNVTLASMPLPASSLLLLAGIAGLGAIRARHKKQSN